MGFELVLESIYISFGAELPRYSIPELWSCDLKRSVAKFTLVLTEGVANSIPLVVLKL